jgi:hypothetical protein
MLPPIPAVTDVPILKIYMRPEPCNVRLSVIFSNFSGVLWMSKDFNMKLEGADGWARGNEVTKGRGDLLVTLIEAFDIEDAIMHCRGGE